MAKAICRKSGIECSISHFPFSFHSGEWEHPAFSLPTKKLLSLSGRWAAHDGKFTDVDSRLLFLSLLHSTSLIEWRTYATPAIPIVEANMEPLIRIVSWIDSIKVPSLSLPHFCISPDTSSLENVEHWIAAWYAARSDFEDGYKAYTVSQAIIRREAALERLIKNPNRKPESYAVQIAEWASLAAAFPTFSVNVRGTEMTCAEYWKSIIVQCGKSDSSVFRIDDADLQELLDHCEENLHFGSIFTHSLFSLLRNAKNRAKDYLGFTIIPSDHSVVEANNIQRLVDAAPDKEPLERDYPSRFAFLRAKAAWNTKISVLMNKSSSDSDIGEL